MGECPRTRERLCWLASPASSIELAVDPLHEPAFMASRSVKYARALLCLITCVVACSAEQAGDGSAFDGPALPVLRLAATPTVVFGDLERSTDEALLDVIAAVRLLSGNIAIADRGAYRVRVYDRQGAPVGQSGRRGRGPGDFDGFASMWRGVGDSLYVWDHAQRRISVLDPNARTVRVWATLDWLPPNSHIVGRFADGSLLAELPVAPDPPSPSGMLTREMLLARVLPDAEQADTLRRVLRTESVVLLDDRGGVAASSRIPLARQGHVAVRGDRFYVGDGTATEIGVFDRQGQVVRRISTSSMNAQISERERAAAMSEVDARSNMPTSLRDALERALAERSQRPMAAYDRLLVDRDGRVWLRSTEGLHNDTRVWMVHHADGTPRGRLRVPAIWDVLSVEADRVLILEADTGQHSRVLEFTVRE